MSTEEKRYTLWACPECWKEVGDPAKSKVASRGHWHDGANHRPVEITVVPESALVERDAEIEAVERNLDATMARKDEVRVRLLEAETALAERDRWWREQVLSEEFQYAVAEEIVRLRAHQRDPEADPPEEVPEGDPLFIEIDHGLNAALASLDQGEGECERCGGEGCGPMPTTVGAEHGERSVPCPDCTGTAPTHPDSDQVGEAERLREIVSLLETTAKVPYCEDAYHEAAQFLRSLIPEQSPGEGRGPGEGSR